MECQVLGIQPVDYVSRKTNKQVKGNTLHVAYPREGVSGMATETVFISDRSQIDLSGIDVGGKVNFSYNRWGSVDSVTVLK